MKKLLLLVFALVLGFVLVNRQRVYVRDPLASVYRNDAKQSGVRVFINYSDDVLLEQDFGDRVTTRTLVQAWNKTPGAPKVLACLQWTACLADADHATIIPITGNGKGAYDPHVIMTPREVSFVDADGVAVRITLR